MPEKESSLRWEKEFQRSYSTEEFQEVSSFWWRDCYDGIEKSLLEKVPLDKNSLVIEYGCGSGISSLRLAPKIEKVYLLDTAESALNCAKQLADYLKVANVEFLFEDAFNMPFKDGYADLCWNVGLLEHYDRPKAKELLKESARVVKDSGYICIGVPNFRSLPIIKARILSMKALRPLIGLLKGYRLDDEKNYNEKKLIETLKEIEKEGEFSFLEISIDYAGSALPIETPETIFNIFNNPIGELFRKFSFLILLTAKVKHNNAR
jgi:ubiquinone/menaquinone biosynthesis C-methylase UbiE